MKSKLIIVLLIGMLIGVFMGGILAPVIVATEYNNQLGEISSYLSTIANNVGSIKSDVDLDEISSYLSTIASNVDSIKSDVDTIETYIKRIARNRP